VKKGYVRPREEEVAEVLDLLRSRLSGLVK